MATASVPVGSLGRRGVQRGRWLFGGIVLIVAAIAAAWWFSTAAQPATTAAPATVPAVRGSITASVAGSGTVAAAQTLQLPFATNGIVTKVFVQEGDTVEAGQVVAKLDARLFSYQVQNARASLSSAQARLDQAQHGNATPEDLTIAQIQLDQAQGQLNALGAKSTARDIAAAQAQLDQAQAQFDKLTAPRSPSDVRIQEAGVLQAELAVKQAELNLANATLRAPFAGVVTALNIMPGSMVSANTPAIELIDRSTLHVDLRLSENDVVNVQLNQPVALQISSLNGKQVAGKVSYLAPAAKVTNGVVTYPVRVSFIDSDLDLKVGMTADLEIITAQRENTLLVPQTALLPKGAASVVQVVDAAGILREVDVETGLSNGTQTEITAGLSESDQVVALPAANAQQNGGGLFGN